MSYPIGSQVKFRGTFRNAEGALADPTVVTFRIKRTEPSPPSSEVLKTYGTDVDLVKESTGIYSIAYTLSEAGTWFVRWKGTGAVIAASPDTFFTVSTTMLTP